MCGLATLGKEEWIVCEAFQMESNCRSEVFFQETRVCHASSLFRKEEVPTMSGFEIIETFCASAPKKDHIYELRTERSQKSLKSDNVLVKSRF